MLKHALDKLYNLLKRKTVSTNFIPAIDGLRFLAIWVVVIDHMQGFVRTKLPFDIITPGSTTYWPIYQFIDANGQKGVLLFFMISGFILGLPFAKHFWQGEKKVILKNYYLRRLTRLEPPYAFNMLACFFLILFYKGHEFTSMFSKSFSGLLPSIASSLTYTHNIFFPHNLSVNPVAWSLEIEVQFYLLVPLLVLIFKLPKLYRRMLLVFLIFFFTFMQSRYNLPVWTIYMFIQYFLAGFLLVDVYLSGFKLKINSFLALLLGMAILFPFFYLDTFGLPYFDFYFIVVAFSFAVLVLTNDFWNKVFSWKFLTAIGGMCYTIYLWHNLVISAVGNISVRYNFSHGYLANLFLQMVILLPAVVLASTVLYLLIEKPCMDRLWPIKLWHFVKRIFKGKAAVIPVSNQDTPI